MRASRKLWLINGVEHWIKRLFLKNMNKPKRQQTTDHENVLKICLDVLSDYHNAYGKDADKKPEVRKIKEQVKRLKEKLLSKEDKQ